MQWECGRCVGPGALGLCTSRRRGRPVQFSSVQSSSVQFSSVQLLRGTDPPKSSRRSNNSSSNNNLAFLQTLSVNL